VLCVFCVLCACVEEQAMLEGLQAKHSNFRTFVAPGAGHCGNTFDSALKETGFKGWLEALLLRGDSLESQLVM